MADGDHFYVCGATWVDEYTTDYVVIKYDWQGNWVWQAIYDQAGFIDAATQVNIDVNFDVVVTGGSASSINDWDQVTLLYDGTTGAPLDTIQVALPGVGLDNALAMYMDDAGNTYVTGYREVNGQKDIQTIKINSDFTLAWVENYDSGDDDSGNAIAVDANGNVYVAGYIGDNAGGTVFTTIKYDSDGNFEWLERYQPVEGEEFAQANKIALADEGVLIAGTISDGESLNYALAKYDTDGRLLWSQEHDNGYGDDEALALAADSVGNVYVSGISETANGPQYTTVKYNIYVVDNDILTDTLGEPLYRENEIMVRFYPKLVDTTFVDHVHYQHISLADLLPATVSEAIMTKMGLNKEVAHQTKVVKLYRNYTRADSISISRLGEQVRMPKIWSTMVMSVEDTLDLKAVCDSLNTLSQYIMYAHQNVAFKPYSNDPMYEEERQPNLDPTTEYSDAHINITPAWTIQTGGPHIKVGVIDNGIKWDHPDFMYNGVTKIGSGRDYVDEPPYNIDTGFDFDQFYGEGGWHGTSCAGIIGALRSNGEGIAGIAGGDVDGEDNIGCNVVPLVVYHNDGINNFWSLLEAAQAIVDGSSDIINSNNGMGCHILNGSWGQRFTPSADFPWALVDAIRVAYANNTVFVNSHGQYGDSTALVSTPFISWPSSFTEPNNQYLLSDYAILVAGASGDDGQWMQASDSANNSMGFFSNAGYAVDLLAPGERSQIPVPGSGNLSDCNSEFQLYGSYTCFWGTSAAAPHVSGVAALMLSEHSVLNGAPNGLSPEDVEILLTLNTIAVPGYDPNIPFVGQSTLQQDYTKYYGNGRLNAAAVLEKVSEPYCVIHSGVPVSTTQTLSTDTVELTVPYFSGDTIGHNLWDLQPGTYHGTLATVVHHYEYEFDPSATIIDSWPRESSTIGTHADSLTVNGGTWSDHVVTYPNAYTIQVSATTHAWRIVELDQWFPAAPADLRTPFTVHTLDVECWGPSVVQIEEIEAEASLLAYPNPANDILFLDHYGLYEDDLTIEIFDLTGRIVSLKRIRTTESTLSFPIGTLSMGTYQVRVSDGLMSAYTRFIKL